MLSCYIRIPVSPCRGGGVGYGNYDSGRGVGYGGDRADARQPDNFSNTVNEGDPYYSSFSDPSPARGYSTSHDYNHGSGDLGIEGCSVVVCVVMVNADCTLKLERKKKSGGLYLEVIMVLGGGMWWSLCMGASGMSCPVDCSAGGVFPLA